MAKKDKKTPISATQWAALLVIAVMIFSTVAFSLLSASQNPPNQTPPANNPNTQNPQTTTPLNFKAQASARVADLLASFKLFATAAQPDIDAIDALVRKSPAVVQVTSSFRQDPSKPGTLLYTADIQFDKSKAPVQQVTDEITANTLGALSTITVFSAVLFEVPHQVSFKNEDLNLTHDYIFLDPLKPGFANSGTQKGDTVSIEMEATFTGSILSNLNVYEISNLSSTPHEYTVTLPFTVSSLEPTLLLADENEFSPGLLKESIEADLQKIPDINGLTVAVHPKEPFVFTIDADLNGQAFQEAVSAIPNPVRFDVISNQKPFQFSMEFAEAGDYLPARTVISKELARQGILEEKLAVKKPLIVIIQIRAELTGNGQSRASQVAQQLQQRLQQKLPNLAVYRSGAVLVNALPQEANNPNAPQYKIESGRLSVLFFPDVELDQNVWVSIRFQTLRGIVQGAAAVQAAPPSP